MSPLHRLVYVSRNTLPEGTDHVAGIERILAVSRRNNAGNGVGGALMFNAGLFAQVLEGERAMLERTFERIQCDERHDKVRILQFEAVAERRFQAWSMAWAGRHASDIDAFAALGTETGFDAERFGGDRVLELLGVHLDAADGARRAA